MASWEGDLRRWGGERGWIESVVRPGSEIEDGHRAFVLGLIDMQCLADICKEEVLIWDDREFGFEIVLEGKIEFPLVLEGILVSIRGCEEHLEGDIFK